MRYNSNFIIAIILILCVIKKINSAIDTDRNAADEKYMNVKKLLTIRTKILGNYGRSVVRPSSCPEKTFAFISEYQFGRSGNNLIEFTHGLWLAKHLNATLVVQDWMKSIFEPFDIDLIHQHYCFSFERNLPKDAKVYDIPSEYSLFLWIMYREKEFKPLLPTLDEKEIAKLSQHFIKVYSLLWSAPKPEIIEATAWLIDNYLDSNFQYTAVHKRSMEGGCNKIFVENTKPEDFSSAEIPTNTEHWHQDLSRGHPICDMSLHHTLAIQQMHHRNASKIFVAHDGRSGVALYNSANAVFSTVVAKSGKFRSVPMMFIDMFTSMNSDLFVQNPRSTYSFEIFVIRVCLGLETIPILKNNDLFVQKIPDDLVKHDRPLWVSWVSIIDAFLNG